MQTQEMELAIAQYFDTRRHLIIPNVSWGFKDLHYEADMVVVTPSGYAREIEIKRSSSDLKKDKYKDHDHDYKQFKELYFAIPEALTGDIKHIPERAGILVCRKAGRGDDAHIRVRPERKAKATKAKKLSMEDRYRLARLGTMRMWNLKRKAFPGGMEHYG